MENEQNTQVTVVDIKMPFLSMVGFMLKRAVAAILAIFGSILTGVLILRGCLWGEDGDCEWAGDGYGDRDRVKIRLESFSETGSVIKILIRYAGRKLSG